MTNLYERAVDLYRAEDLPLMRDHFFRLALNRLGPAELLSLLDAMTSSDVDELRDELKVAP